MFKRKNPHDEEGFTLVELMIVMVILGILIAIAIPQVSAYRSRANNALALDALRSAMTLQEAYFIDHDTYTQNDANLAGFCASPDVQLFIDAASATGYTMRATHDNGTLTHAVTGPGGDIIRY